MSTASPGEAVAFFTIAAIILASGLASSLARRTFHSVMFLGVTLVAVAALYILLGSPIVGVLQILVYVGGILTLFVFAVMFVAGDETETDDSPTVAGRGVRTTFALSLAANLVLLWTIILAPGAIGSLGKLLPGGTLVAFLLVAIVLGGLAYALYRMSWTGKLALSVSLSLGALLIGAVAATTPWMGMGAPEAIGPAGAPIEEADLLADLLFGHYVLAFEILGVLLTAAMIGALVIARPLGQEPDESHYHKTGGATLAATMHVSDPIAQASTLPPAPAASPATASTSPSPPPTPATAGLSRPEADA